MSLTGLPWDPSSGKICEMTTRIEAKNFELTRTRRPPTAFIRYISYRMNTGSILRREDRREDGVSLDQQPCSISRGTGFAAAAGKALARSDIPYVFYTTAM